MRVQYFSDLIWQNRIIQAELQRKSVVLKSSIDFNVPTKYCNVKDIYTSNSVIKFSAGFALGPFLQISASSEAAGKVQALYWKSIRERLACQGRGLH